MPFLNEYCNPCGLDLNLPCSFLKFFDQVLDGEMKEDLPKWAGINSIRELLGEISTTISSLNSTGTSGELTDAINKKDYG